MKKIIIIISFMFLSLPGICKNKEDSESNLQNFSDLGRYVETLEINRNIEENNNNYEEEDESSFEDEAIIDVAKRYEKNIIELQLDAPDETALNSVNNERIFKLRVNETQFNIEQNIKAENMIWDADKSFSQAFHTSSRHLAPIPSVVNSQNIQAQVSPSLSAVLGQTTLNDAVSTSVLFVRANESTYNTGSVISYKGDSLNLAAGSFTSSYNNASSGGAVLSSNPYKLPFNSGSFLLGSAFFNKEEQDYNKTTGGFFGEYKYKRLKLNAQIGQSKYSNSNNIETSLYFIPEFKISDSLYLKTRFIRNVSQDNMQDELALTYKPKSSKNNFEFEINASRQYTQNDTIKQRIKLSTSFRI